MHTSWKIVGISTLGLLALAVFVLCSSRSVNIPVGTEEVIHIKPASLLASFLDSKCSMTYRSMGKDSGVVLLLETRVDWPILVIPSRNSSVILCLYDYDGDLRLLKIDRSKTFKNLADDTPLSFIVLSSPWQIDDGNNDDWQRALRYLEEVDPDSYKNHTIPSFDVRFMRSYVDRKQLLQRVVQRMKFLFKDNRIN